MLPSPGTGDVRRRWDLCVMWWYKGECVEEGGGAVERGGEETWWDMVRMDGAIERGAVDVGVG